MLPKVPEKVKGQKNEIFFPVQLDILKTTKEKRQVPNGTLIAMSAFEDLEKFYSIRGLYFA